MCLSLACVTNSPGSGKGGDVITCWAVDNVGQICWLLAAALELSDARTALLNFVLSEQVCVPISGPGALLCTHDVLKSLT